MDEHDDDLDPEVIEGEELEREAFDPDDDESVQSAEPSDEGEPEVETDDESEI